LSPIEVEGEGDRACGELLRFAASRRARRVLVTRARFF
jgi:hypothetical protein